MQDILNFSREELSEWLEKHEIRPFRAKQIFKWIYIRQAENFDEMTDVGKNMRTLLIENFDIPRLHIETIEKSIDKTEKFLFRLKDGNHIESVLIPVKDHYTLCISSQVGCAQNCKFCLTAKGGFKRNLTSSEIISQIRDIRWHLLKNDNKNKLSNIVFMGMGEPLANYDTIVQALKVMTDADYGLKLSVGKITISTCGLVPEMEKLGLVTNANLAVSLNATNDETRSMLMPINNKYPLKQLLDACKTFKMRPRNKITFEYILIDGVNDTEDDAVRLCKMLAPIKAKINLIPFNEHDRTTFKKPSDEKVSRFLQILLDKNFTAIIRKSKGNDISAACGQLKAKL
ncbi:MAG: 23S rRNA (adenine(2503)-C(2))-methyltransferase RlmN, partial [Desulfobacteraceae bacterium]|nr:23S rRNA (adenine(2503)-C(2))-methyltransferase RlmN [Desulfobacteraceae bacterium]